MFVVHADGLRRFDKADFRSNHCNGHLMTAFCTVAASFYTVGHAAQLCAALRTVVTQSRAVEA
jgi:hypothetical protein